MDRRATEKRSSSSELLIVERALELGPLHSDSCLPISNEGLELDADRRSLEGLVGYDSNAIGNWSRTTQEKAGSVGLDALSTGLSSGACTARTEQLRTLDLD